MKDLNEKSRFLELLIKAYEGTLNPDETRVLNEDIKTDHEAAHLYVEFFDVVSGLVDLTDMPLSLEEDSASLDAWINFFAEYEKTAQTVEIHEEDAQEDFCRTEHPRLIYKRKLTSWDRITFAAIAAMVVFMILFSRFAPDRIGQEVVKLTDSLNAKWADVDTSMQIGKRLCTGKKALLLREGLVKMTFDTQAQVVIEAPAEFQILAEDRIGMRYGKIYSTVPQEAIGFSIYTPNAKVVDMGTEFGVQADTRGDTHLHVIKGRTMLIAGEKSNKVSMEVGKGIAKKVSGENQAITDISFDNHLFARDIDSIGKSVWCGQSGVDLADIVGGGDGFGSGGSCIGINPATGKWVSELLFWDRDRENSPYIPMLNMPCIDGVFVPAGEGGPQVITSRGHIFEDCPATNGHYWVEITNKPQTSVMGNADGKPEDIQQAALNGVQYGTLMHSAIMLHANAGITFDLNAVRSMVHGVQIRSFTSLCGLSDTLLNTSHWGNVQADMWILVDGQMRQSVHLNTDSQRYAPVNVAINENDRFLTLIATDGNNGNGGDWTLFGDPVLKLEPAE